MLKYRPEIDGLRAVAVIPVILFHLGFEWINGGYFGVDVFFVISGFLITSIILKELNSNVFSILNFWKRRIRRILPLTLVVIITILLFCFFVAFKPNLITYANDAISATFSYSNISFYRKFGDYWGAAAEISPFLHTWSLAIEEQFYLIYPFILILLFKYKISLIKSLSIIIILSFSLFVYGSYILPNATFFLLPTRVWELAIGGLIAVLGPSKIPFLKYKKALPIIGFCLILVSFVLFTGNNGIGISVIFPVLGAAMIIAYSNKDDFISSLLSHKNIVFIGNLSFSLYLWHWPIIVFFNLYFFKYFNFEIIGILVVLVLTFSLSFITYIFIEKPTRASKHTFKAVFGLIITVIVITSFFKSSFLNTNYLNDFNKVVFHGLYYDITPTIKAISKNNILKRKGIIAPERDSTFVYSYKDKGILIGENKDDPEILVLGDSHGAMWAKVIDEIGYEFNLNRSFYTSVGNQPFFKVPIETKKKKTAGFTELERELYAYSFIENLMEWSPKVLIISCRWSSLNDENMNNMEELIKLTINKEINVILINEPPIIDLIGNNNSAQYLSYLGYKPDGENQYIELSDSHVVDKANEKIMLLSLRYKNTFVFDINSYFRVEDEALIIVNQDILYYDDDHLSYQGTSLLKDKLKEIIKDLTNK